MKALTKELEVSTGIAAKTNKGHTLIKSLGKGIKAILNPPIVSKQTVDNSICEVTTQRKPENIVPITRISDAPVIMKARNPTAKRNLIKDTGTHQRITRNNTPGAVPAIKRMVPTLILPDTRPAPVTRTSNRDRNTKSPVSSIPQDRLLGRGTQTSVRLISQRALNAMTMQEALTPPTVFTPRKLIPREANKTVQIFAHFASPMVHPTTGETISSYRQLMNDPETAEVWQTAFGKDFGRMAQGNNKTGQKGTNSVFVMTHNKINIAKAAGHKWTYARIVVDYCPQKEDPNRIRIAVGGNMITYKGNTSTRTADLTTSKLLWNSVLSTEGARYMCLDLKNFYLMAALDYYKYMKILLTLFPEWIRKQYNLDTHARDSFVFLEIRRAVCGLPQAGTLANKLLRKRLKPHGYYKCVNTPGLWRHATRPITFSLMVDNFGVKYVGKEHADHLISCLKRDYKLTKDWAGDLYCGISLKGDYARRWLDISMPGYIKKQLLKYKHIMRRIQHCPHLPKPKR